LYTTIRELVENSLDAAESISVLPEVTVTMEEMTEDEMNLWRGLAVKTPSDAGLFAIAQKVRLPSDTAVCRTPHLTCGHLAF
jgi:hypothetical protein